MRPVDLVGFSDDHSLAVLPFVFCGELGVFLVVVVATVSTTDIFGELAPVIVELRGIGVSLRALSELVVLSDRVVLCTQMPVDIDGAHGALPVVLDVGDNADIHTTNVSLGDVGASLRTRKMDAVNVFELGVHAGAGILSLAEDGGNARRDVVRDVRHLGLDCDRFGCFDDCDRFGFFDTAFDRSAFGDITARDVTDMGSCKQNDANEKTDGGDDRDSKGKLELEDRTTLVDSRGFGGLFLGRLGWREHI